MTGVQLADEVSLVDATEVARFASGWRAGTPAVTMKESGRGRAVYLAASLDDTSVGIFAEYLLGLVGVESLVATPPGVRVYNRSSDSVGLRFAVNYTNEEREVELGEGWTDAFSGEACGSVRVPAVDLRVAQRG
ncbi:MAG: beta-galactosidase trimerization domain-containing protein [bacterium]